MSIIHESVRTALEARPRTIIMTPVLDAKPDVLYVNSLLWAMMTLKADAHQFVYGDSNIPHARNKILNLFWRLTDFERVVLIDADIGWSAKDWEYLMEGPEDVVCAEYARKTNDPKVAALPVRGGMGFVRIHRRALQRLYDWRNDEGDERIPRYYEDGQICLDYHYTGATSDGHWMSEDRGFFKYCSLADISFRRETRTRLDHAGRAVYHYLPVTEGMDSAEEP